MEFLKYNFTFVTLILLSVALVVITIISAIKNYNIMGSIFCITFIIFALIGLTTFVNAYVNKRAIPSNDIKIILENRGIDASDDEVEIIRDNLYREVANFTITLRDQTNNNRAFKITFIKESKAEGLIRSTLKYGIYAANTDGTSIKVS